MKRLKEVEKFINKFLGSGKCEDVVFENYDDELAELGIGQEDNTLYILKNDKYIAEGVEAVIKLANLKFNIKIKFTEIGGFDSPGYDVNCYAWAGIVDEELLFGDFISQYY